MGKEIWRQFNSQLRAGRNIPISEIESQTILINLKSPTGVGRCTASVICGFGEDTQLIAGVLGDKKVSAKSAAAITVDGSRRYFGSSIVFGLTTNILCEQLKSNQTHAHLVWFHAEDDDKFVSWGRQMPINSDFYLSKQLLLSCTKGINVCALEQLEAPLLTNREQAVSQSNRI